MAEFILSAFADEASMMLDEQIRVLNGEGIKKIELRGVDGLSCADIDEVKAREVSAKLKASGISLSALGSPYGKIGINDPFEPHLEQLKRSLEICHILECNRIRMFSFYIPEGFEAQEYREEVLERLGRMVESAESEDVYLCHENEKGIYGDTALRCADLRNCFGDRLGVIFDPANYIQVGTDPLEAYELQKKDITYFHMKDALKSDGSVVSVGRGDGSIPKILKDIDESTDNQVILTVEPHLHVFGGLNSLQQENLKNHESYPDSFAAFHAACSAVKKCLDEIRG